MRRVAAGRFAGATSNNLPLFFNSNAMQNCIMVDLTDTE
jgi:hypothetical protein